MTEPKKSCFIIMPITTPPEIQSTYRDGAEHFQHVLQCLFLPAVKSAGFEAIPPKAKGSDLIHAEIIKHLESADLVLCDMSGLNANVFFEFGIRTSLNKPVCVVKDENTSKVPFDTNILNYQEYASSLNSWEIDTEITRLEEHLRQSETRSKGVNTLWKYFGFKGEAQAPHGATGVEAKVEYLSFQVDTLGRRIEEVLQTAQISRSTKGITQEVTRLISDDLSMMMPPTAKIASIEFDDTLLEVTYVGHISERERSRLVSRLSSRFGVSLFLRPAPQAPAIGGPLG